MNPQEIAHALSLVLDPELGIDIVSLGLVYGIQTEPGRVHIDLTVTSPECPMGDAIVGAAARRIAAAAGDVEIGFEIVDEPPWSISMIDQAARRKLGLPAS